MSKMPDRELVTDLDLWAKNVARAIRPLRMISLHSIQYTRDTFRLTGNREAMLACDVLLDALRKEMVIDDGKAEIDRLKGAQ